MADALYNPALAKNIAKRAVDDLEAKMNEVARKFRATELKIHRTTARKQWSVGQAEFDRVFRNASLHTERDPNWRMEFYLAPTKGDSLRLATTSLSRDANGLVGVVSEVLPFEITKHALQRFYFRQGNLTTDALSHEFFWTMYIFASPPVSDVIQEGLERHYGLVWKIRTPKGVAVVVADREVSDRRVVTWLDESKEDTHEVLDLDQIARDLEDSDPDGIRCGTLMADAILRYSCGFGEGSRAEESCRLD